MKIVLTKKEIKSVKDFCLEMGDTLTVVDSNAVQQAVDLVNNFEEEIESLYNIKMFKAKFNLKGELVLEVSEDYVVEFMTLYSEFIALALPQMLALFKTLELFFKKYTKLTDKYLETEDEEIVESNEDVE